MNWKIASTVLVFVCLALFGNSGNAPACAQTAPVVFTTSPKLITGHLRIGSPSDFPVRGRASLTLTAVNNDDTLTGTLTYYLPEDARQKIAQASGKALKDVASSVQIKNVIAGFQRGTACPSIKLEVALKEMDAGGVMLFFDRMSLDIPETQNQINQLFCSWTRQINAKRQRHGIIAAINRLITVEN